MDKRALAKIEPTPAPERRGFKDRTWLMVYGEHGDVDSLTFWDTRTWTRVYMVFFTDSEYLTRDMTSKKLKWYTGMLNNILWREDRYWNWKFEMASSEDEEKFRKRFKEINGTSSLIGMFYAWQRSILDDMLHERHLKELEPARAEMSLIPEPPADLDDFIKNEVLYNYRYIIYKHTSKTAGMASCTHCKQIWQYDKKSFHPKRGERGICPHCGSEVTYATPHMKLGPTASIWAAVIQKYEDRIAVRCYQTIVRFHTTAIELVRDIRLTKIEIVRGIYTWNAKGKVDCEVYEYTCYKQDFMAWNTKTDLFNCLKGVLYTRNLPHELKGTPFQYCAIDQYQKLHGTDQSNYWRYLQRYVAYPKLEILTKAGMTALVDDITDTWQSGITDIFGELNGFQRPYLRQLQQVNGDRHMLTLIKQCQADKVMPSNDALIGYHKVMGSRYAADELLGMINSRADKYGLDKCMRYFKKQSAKSGTPMENLIKDWRDYISWCAKMHYDLEDPYYYLPPDFIEAHERVHKEYKAEQDRLEALRIAEQEKAYKKIRKEAAAKDGIVYCTKSLILKMPEKLADIKAEGKALHHCVGTYTGKVAEGKTMILFVREKEEPDKPYFTMEYKDGKVIQCRGMRNCAMTDDVKKLVKEFEEKMERSINAGKKVDKKSA